MRPVVVLGATGSIGKQSLQVADHLGMPVVGIASRGSPDSVGELVCLAERYPQAAIAASHPAPDDHQRLQEKLGSRYQRGYEAMLEMAVIPGAVVVNGIVGVKGLAVSVATLQGGNRLALANKESLVAGGPLVMRAAQFGELIPVDSEHSALFQCLVGEEDLPGRLILTASGGPFRGLTADRLARVGIADALAHPTWEMGERITVDSATLVNKGMEVIEAHFLFGVDYGRIEVVIHPQSIVHSMVEFSDGSVKAQLGWPDMRIPIQYALTFPQRAPAFAPRFDPTVNTLTFESPDRKTFPALDLAYQSGRQGGTFPAVFNAADEVAVRAFLQGQIPFVGICEVIAEVLEGHESVEADSVEEIMEVDRQARRQAEHAVARR